MQETINYNIHNILSFQINRPKYRDFIKDINLPYSYFETERIDKPEIILNIGPFKPQNQNCYIVDHKWHIKRDYLYCSEHIGRIRFDIEITGLETNETIINVNTNFRQIKQLFFPSVLAQHVVLSPIIEHKLLSKGFLLIHAAAAANDEGALVFLGRGGVFKTTLLMDYVRRLNYRFLGDDKVILNKNSIYCYPLHNKLFDYRTKRMDTENYSMIDKYKYVYYLQTAKDKSPYIADKREVSAIFLISRFNQQKMRVVKLPKKDVVAKTLVSFKLENIRGFSVMATSKGLYDYFTAYSYVFSDSKIACYWDMYESLLKEYLDSNEYYEIFLPHQYTKTTFEDFINTVKALK